jgi:hypothetical protein
MAYIGYCGDNCELCPRYIATKSKDVEQLKEAAILWAKVGLHDGVFHPKKMVCNGCASFEHCVSNNIRECARDKGISSCGKCTEYPCDQINAIFDKTDFFAKQCKEKCDPIDYQWLHSVFFSKKERLDAIHQECIEDAKRNLT